MKVTILTAYTNSSVADQIENLIQQAAQSQPDIYTELNFQRSNGGLVAEWFHPNLGEANLDYREALYKKLHEVLPPSHLAIIEDEESQEITTIGDLGYFKQVIQQARTSEELEEIRDRINQTEISNPLLKQILHRAYQTRNKALRLTVS